MTNKRDLTATLLCFSVAIIWGMGYIFIPMATSAGLNASFTNAVRFIGASFLYLIIFIKKISLSRSSVIYGSLAGLFLAGAFMLLTFGQMYTTPSNSAFLQSMCTVIIPFLSWVFFKRKPSPFIALSIVLYVVGVYILCNKSGEAFSFNIGDVLALGSAVCFAVHYIIVSKGLLTSNSHSINVIQFAVAGLLCLMYCLIFEKPIDFAIVNTQNALIALLGLTLLNTLYAYGVQTYSQIYLIDYKISLIMSTENIWAVLFSVVLSYETLRLNTILGGIIIMLAILSSETLPQLISRIRQRKNDK